MFDVQLPPNPPLWTVPQPEAPAAHVQRCPICEGRGTIPAGFRRGRDHATRREQCRECGGRGMLVVSAFGTVSKLLPSQPS